jgi:hypothetical protein
MEYPINEQRFDAICDKTGLSYKVMVLQMLGYIANNLEEGIDYSSYRVIEGCIFYDITEAGVKRPYTLIQLVYATLPYKFYFKLKLIGINFQAMDRTTEFELFVWLLYKQADKLTNHFTIKLK